MRSASQFFSAEDRQRVAEAVRKAESQTSAEILPVITTSSGRYDRAEDLMGVWFAVLCLSLTWWLVPFERSEPGSWEEWPVILEWAALVASVIFGFLFGAVIASRVAWLRRLCTPKAQMFEEVAGRARQVFFDNRIHHTGRAHGVLLYASLYERRAIILADQSVIEVLGEAAIGNLSHRWTTALRQHELVDALCRTIDELGDRLGVDLPRLPDDANELADALVTMD